MNVLFLIMTTLLGAFIGWLGALIFRKTTKQTQVQMEKSLLETQALLKKRTEEQSQTEKSLIEKQTLLNQTMEEKHRQEGEIQKLRADRLQREKELSTLLAEKHSQQTLKHQFEEHFKNLSQEILESKCKQFQQTAKEDLGHLLNPLKDNISAFQKRVEETYNQEARERYSLKDSIKSLCEVHEGLKTETLKLSKALKGDVKAQGQWGEMILSAVLSASGLKEGEHYVTQGKGFNLKDEEGKRQKPDVIVKLPGGKHIVVDAKVSLTHYESLISTDSQEQKQNLTSQFISSLRSHIDTLSKKKYQHPYQHQPGDDSLNTPDFVLMFFPIEGAFSLALQSHPDLFSYSWDHGVVIVSPTTLLATLKTVAWTWQKEKQNRNALEIATESGRLYDKFETFTGYLSEIGSSLDKAKNSYEKARTNLQDGKGNIISKLDKIKQLGAKTSKHLPDSFLPSDSKPT